MNTDFSVKPLIKVAENLTLHTSLGVEQFNFRTLDGMKQMRSGNWTKRARFEQKRDTDKPALTLPKEAEIRETLGLSLFDSTKQWEYKRDSSNVMT